MSANPTVPDSDYVPSTAQVRRSYDGQWDTSSPHGPAAAAEFDRWLQKHEAQTAARALHAVARHYRETDGLGLEPDAAWWWSWFADALEAEADGFEVNPGLLELVDQHREVEGD